MAKLAGKWNMVKTENFEEYMKAVGVGMLVRKMGASFKPSQLISCDGDKWTIKTVTSFKTTEISFTPGVEFDETTADGRNMKTTVTIEGDSKITMDQKGKIPSVQTRELQGDDTMVLTLAAKDVVCTRTYKRE